VHKRLVRALTATAASIAACLAPAQVEPADAVILSGNIYTVDHDRPRAQAIAIDNGEITAVGTDPEIRRFIGEDTEVIDANGMTVLPGFIDAHGHIVGLGRVEEGVVDLRGTAYTDDVVATGFGAQLAMPILRQKWRPDLSEGEAVAILEDCLRVLFYRDCRAADTIVLSKASADGTLVSEPRKIDSDWSSQSFVAPKADDDGDGGW